MQPNTLPYPADPARGIPGAQCGDYAVVGVDGPIDNFWSIDGQGAMPAAAHPAVAGQSYRLTSVAGKTRLASLTDGTSNTALMGEKHIPRRCLGFGDRRSGAAGGQPFCGDGSLYICGNGPGRGYVLRNLGAPLARSLDELDIHQFGSWHSGICQFVLGDGSVRGVTNTTSIIMLTRLGHRQDGQVLDLP